MAPAVKNKSTIRIHTKLHQSQTI